MTNSPIHATDYVNLEEEACEPIKRNWFTDINLSWLNSLIKKGKTHNLQENDVFPLRDADTAVVLHERFTLEWAKQLEKPIPKLDAAIWNTFKREITCTLLLYSVSASLTLLQPWLIKSIVQYLEQSATNAIVQTSIGITSGYGLAGLLAVVSTLAVITGDYAQCLAAQIGCNVKSIFIDIVFLKTLQLSGNAKQTLSSGDVVTMTTVDSEKMLLGFWMGFWSVVAPAILLVILVLMGLQLGVTVGLISSAIMCGFMAAGYYSGTKVGFVKRQLLKVQAERVKLMSEILQGIRVVKLYAWEEHLREYITAVRMREFQLVRKYQVMRVVNTVTLYAAPLVTMAAALVSYVALGNELSSTTAFTVLALMNTCMAPCMIFSNAVMHVSDALASSERVNQFLLREEMLEAPASSTQKILSLDNATFAWHQKPILHHINLEISTTSPSLTIIVGAVGSGKSSLIHALLGEMTMLSGSRTVSGSISFVNQESWIMHDTLRNNILFTSCYDEAKYHQVLSACQLLPDLASLPNSDSTEIGERGINLSGGQKARVSLARALYKSDADIFLLDDPLSALDVHVASRVFTECVQGLLSTKTTLLVLNSHYHFLPHADRIIVMADGTIVGDGSFDELKDVFPHLLSSHGSAEATTKPQTTQELPQKESTQTLIAQEERIEGAVRLQTYTTYFGSSGWNGTLVVCMVFVSYLACQGCIVAGDIYLGHWSSTPSLLSSISAGGVYGGIMGVALLLVCARSLFVLYIAQSCSLHFHDRLFRKVLSLSVPLFFDVTPVGRILNRFSSDLDTLDSQIPFYGYLLLQFIFQILALIIVCGITTPYVLIAYPLMLYCFYKLQTYFNPTSGALKRMESITRSPLVTLVSETLSGLATIRAFGLNSEFIKWNRARLDRHMQFFSTFYLSRCWFQMRLDWMSASIIIVVAFVCIALRSSLGVVAAGLSLTYAAQSSFFLSRAAMWYNNMDNMMTCVERLAHYDSYSGEDDTQGCLIPQEQLQIWPTQPTITFENVSMRYRPDLPQVLRNISLSIGAQEKIGICGRTGSGKSSFMSALFRLVEVESGAILIDSINIAQIPVTTLRSKLTIIPQDPVLFSGKLRFNLDPSQTHCDEELWRVLKLVHLAPFLKTHGGLDCEVAEKGSNFSIGQRQLLCIARALLRQSHIVVLDEATANVDIESDKLIQEAIRTCFSQVTLLVIAHRLETIVHCDRILVLNQGQVDEFDSPANLIAQKGTFASLLQQANLNKN